MIFFENIETLTLNNTNYRKVLYTSTNQQIVIMSIDSGSDIEFEIHPDNDQFIRIESGTGILLVGKNRDSKYKLYDGVAFVIPKNTWHQVINNSSSPLKLYTIYSPPHHKDGKIDVVRPPSDEISTHNKFDKPDTKYPSVVKYQDIIDIYSK